MATNPPPPSDRYAAALIALFTAAEQALLAGSTRVLRAVPVSWEGRQILAARLRGMVRRVTRMIDTRATPLAAAMVTAAAREGVQDALVAVGSGAGGSGRGKPPHGAPAVPTDPFDLSLPHGERAAQAIRDDIVSSLTDVRHRITRLPNDVYKAIAPHGGIYQVIDNDVTPAQAQAMAWRVFTSQGITGFTDKSGRDWSLSAYVEMAVRTAAARAYNSSHLARMQALGINYFTIGTSDHPCPLCWPWQGAVLTDGIMVDPVIPVDATIAEATAAGLFHPNCKHTLIPVFPGVTVLPPRQVWTVELQAAYDLSQKQRALELAVRKAKTAALYALTPEEHAAAQVKVRRAQAKVREFVKATGFARQSRREQVNLTDGTIKLPTPIR